MNTPEAKPVRVVWMGSRLSLETTGTLALRGDTVAALTMLSPDVLIMEGGDIETLSDYRSHHLSEDMAYARAIAGVSTVRRVVVQHDVA